MATMLRAEKTTQNNDDFKVLLVGCVFALVLLTVVPVISRGWDMYMTPRPFVVASTLELVPIEGSDVPGILYDADAHVNVDATWVATIETRNEYEGPLYLIPGQGSYSVQREDKAKVWTWKSWFDNGLGATTPEVPKHPFKVCVRYVSLSKETKVVDETPKFCSSLYDPILKKDLSQ